MFHVSVAGSAKAIVVEMLHLNLKNLTFRSPLDLSSCGLVETGIIYRLKDTILL